MSASVAGDGLQDVVDRLPAVCHRARREYEDLLLDSARLWGKEHSTPRAGEETPSDAPVHFLQVTEHETIQEIAAMLPKDHPARVQLLELAVSSHDLAQSVLDLHKELHSYQDSGGPGRFGQNYRAAAGPAATGGPVGPSDGPTPEVQKGPEDEMDHREGAEGYRRIVYLSPACPKCGEPLRIECASCSYVQQPTTPRADEKEIPGLVQVPLSTVTQAIPSEPTQKTWDESVSAGATCGVAAVEGYLAQRLGRPVTEAELDLMVTFFGKSGRLEDARGRLSRILYREDHAELGPDLVEELKQVRGLLIPPEVG